MEKLSILRVSLIKLKRYTEQQGGYDLDQTDDSLVLSFVPSFPEALEKGWENSSPPRVIMRGKINNGEVIFNLVEVEQDNQIKQKELDVAEFTYKSWLQYIEDNY